MATDFKVKDVEEALSSVITSARVEELSRQTGFIKRRRKIDPVALVWTLVLGFGVGDTRELNGLRRFYERHTGTTLVPSAFYDRFTAALVVFLKVLLGEVLSRMSEPQRQLSGCLKAFKDVVLADATVLRLHALLADTWESCGRSTGPAAAKLHVVMSAVGCGPYAVKLTGERTDERRSLPVGPWLKDRLLLFDLGYYDFRLFDRLDRNGAFFVSRLKRNANPRIVRLLTPVRGRAVKVEGRRLQEVLPELQRQHLDVEVEVSFKRRAYKGKRSTGRTTFRCVAARNEQTGRYHLYLTNAPAEKLTPTDVERCYAARWEIELLFARLKGDYRLDQFPSANPHVVEALIYAAILTLTVSRSLWFRFRRRFRTFARYCTQGRWAILIHELHAFLATIAFTPCRLASEAACALRMLTHEAADPYLKRDGGLLARIEEGYV